jgi:hypothetical protein
MTTKKIYEYAGNVTKINNCYSGMRCNGVLEITVS